MKPEKKIESFEEKLTKLVDEYEIKNAAFCGQRDEEYVGFVVGKHNLLSMWEVVLNVGRLWQHMRENTRSTLNRFERGWK